MLGLRLFEESLVVKLPFVQKTSPGLRTFIFPFANASVSTATFR